MLTGRATPDQLEDLRITVIDFLTSAEFGSGAIAGVGNVVEVIAGLVQDIRRQVEALGNEGDIAIGISTSGNSPNVLEALKAARAKGLVTVGLSGRDGGKMTEACDILLVVPSDTTARIQEMHITLGHMLCGALEQKLGLLG